uniref:Uncharacterized protein n=1 Tax=Pseudomonas fluorescens (strain SBW25) TaxID=216595 RepID=A0A0G4E5J2_PSEFS|nr:hypothetical protein [Pseudomonas fluorescens]CEK42293.1 hypothetical protein PQBR57_0340 [Pseudomonas fluorescens SBW25]
MTKTVSAIALGASLLAATLIFAVIGLQSVTGMQSAILKAALKAPDSPAIDALLVNWPNLVTPLAFCIATPLAILLIGSIMAFRGDLKVIYK